MIRCPKCGCNLKESEKKFKKQAEKLAKIILRSKPWSPPYER